MAFIYRDSLPTDTEVERQNDIEAAILLTQLVVNLANLTMGQFVSRPPAIDAQVELEKALLAVSKRIAEREAG